MLRRNVRLRKEYLYRKGLEGKERAAYERKRLIRKALEEGKPIPTELRKDESELRREIELEDDNTAVPRTHVDDEYAHAGETDPKVLVTTSRDPSSRLTQFAKEMKLVIPNSQRINRGGLILKELVDTCRNHDFTDIVVLHEHRGEPDGMVVCHLPYGPTAYFGIFNTVLRHDIGQKKEVGTISEAYPHLVLDNLGSKLGARTANILKHLFPVPKDDAKRIVTFSNRQDYISFRHHTYAQPKGASSIELTECGPRFELKLYQIKLGTLDQSHAENEWVLRAYTRNTKRARLGDDGDQAAAGGPPGKAPKLATAAAAPSGGGRGGGGWGGGGRGGGGGGRGGGGRSGGGRGRGGGGKR
ncbi:hypothetical protein CHLRE_10g454100v5 [Chlamydomonas reinhardtii]|uniref:Brix domain-containing protein n=1 Tax=Chlamydomonas reinhardtii TaxID=3055 RepID=A0A2K3DBD9_CHLRE|nr:uncharacterized protein CHLRE_10g454100v5 [Chlamydomonas reinhardtii]PNW77846.1 hypothetical protein CHLRE_10g454100v5 [Chlamydomonas reinhardtii]